MRRRKHGALAPRRRRRRTAAAVAAAGAAALALAQCGLGSGSSENPPPRCDTPGVTENEIHFGLIYSYSGPGSSLFLATQAGVDARLGVANDNGGVQGRQLTYEWRDDETDPTVNLTAARDLVENSDVFMVAEGSTVASGSAAYLNAIQVPVVGASLELAWTRYQNMFSYSNYVTDGPASDVWGRFVRQQGGTRAVILESRFNEFSLTLADKIGESLQAAGVEVVEHIDVTPDALNPVSIPEQIRASGADVLSGALPGEAFVGVYTAAVDAGADIQVALSPTGYDQSLIEQFGDALAGVYYFVNHTPFEVDTEAHRTFLAAVTAHAPQLQPAANHVALTGWIIADIAVRALERAGPCPTRNSFVAAMRDLDDYDADGLLTAPIDLGANFAALENCYSFVRVSPTGEEFEVVEPVRYCGNPVPAS